MPRPRTPLAKAAVAGAALVNPGRYKTRKGPAKVRAIGIPYVGMSADEKRIWNDLVKDMPWLNRAHRTLLRLACMWTARMDDKDFGVSATQALSSILSKLGATPVDETKVNHGGNEEEDPADKFFKR